MSEEPKSWDDVNETGHLNEASMEVTHTEFMRWQNRLAAVEAERDALREALEGKPSWEDRDDDLTEAINAAHPVYTGDYKTWMMAQDLVGNRHSKGALVNLVNYLLAKHGGSDD